MTRQQAISRFLIRYFLFELAFFGVVGAFGLVSGWRTSTEYCNALFIVGAIIIILGLSRLRVIQAERGFQQQYAATVGTEGAANRAQRIVRESAQSFGSASHLMLLGITPIIGSLIVLAVVGW
jgi:hypothetical protein